MKKKKKERKKERKRDFNARNIWFITMDYISKRNLFETKQRTRSLEFIRVFFFFFSRCYHRGTFNVANVPFSTRNISVFEFNIVSLVLGIGNFFKSPEIFFFFFFCLMKILVFFFLHPRRFSLNNSFAMDIVGQMELELFFSLYVYFFRWFFFR